MTTLHQRYQLNGKTAPEAKTLIPLVVILMANRTVALLARASHAFNRWPCTRSVAALRGREAAIVRLGSTGRLHKS